MPRAPPPCLATELPLDLLPTWRVPPPSPPLLQSWVSTPLSTPWTPPPACSTPASWARSTTAVRPVLCAHLACSSCVLGSGARRAACMRWGTWQAARVRRAAGRWRPPAQGRVATAGQLCMPHTGAAAPRPCVHPTHPASPPAAVARGVQKVLQDYRNLQDIIAILGMDELSEEVRAKQCPSVSCLRVAAAVQQEGCGGLADAWRQLPRASAARRRRPPCCSVPCCRTR